MQRMPGQSQAGFTMIELMIVVAIMAIISAIAAPSFTRYQRREDARRNAQNIGRIISEARSRAIDRSRNHFLIFSNPLVFQVAGGGGAPSIATLVEDVDGDWQITTPPDTTQLFFAADGTDATVSGYGLTPWPFYDAAPVPPEDQPAAGPPANLGALAGRSSTFPNASFNALPTLGFTPQGLPVAVNGAATPGSGAGAVYVTDNQSSVYAAIVLPLGGVRVRVLDGSNPAQLVWR